MRRDSRFRRKTKRKTGFMDKRCLAPPVFVRGFAGVRTLWGRPLGNTTRGAHFQSSFIFFRGIQQRQQCHARQSQIKPRQSYHPMCARCAYRALIAPLFRLGFRLGIFPAQTDRFPLANRPRRLESWISPHRFIFSNPRYRRGGAGMNEVASKKKRQKDE